MTAMLNFVALFITLGCVSSNNTQAFARGPAQAYPQSFSPSYGEVLDGEEWFKKVQQTIQTHKVQSIDQLLKLLPEELRSRHVFMFKSHSLQEGSYQGPRALLFSPGATFVMSFNGDPSQAGFEALETMRFTQKSGRPEFKFEEIVLSGDLNARRQWLQKNGKPADLDHLLDRSTRTGPNPSLCLTCHRQDARPNWGQYKFWEGAYGQIDGIPFAQEVCGIPDQSSGHSICIDNRQAAKELVEFVSNAPEKERYRNILDIGSQIDGHNTNNGKPSKNHINGFSHALSVLNYKRIAYLMSKSKYHPLPSYLFLMYYAKCNIESDLIKKLYSADSKWLKYDLRPGHLKPAEFEGYLHTEFALSWSDLSWQDFFMNMYPGRGNDFTSPINDMDEIPAALMAYLPELKPYIKVDESKGYYPYPPTIARVNEADYAPGTCDFLTDKAKKLAAKLPRTRKVPNSSGSETSR